MQVEWYGQSAFRFTSPEATVFIDPHGPMEGLPEGMRFDYPAIVGVSPDLLIVTHEHGDHNRVDQIDGDPVTIRSLAGRHESPIGDVIAVASEHDDVAGTERGPNTIVVFTLGGVRVAHFGDFGQSALRDAQRAAIGDVDLAIVPAGGGFTVDGTAGYALGRAVGAKWIVPMHYNTPRISFLEPLDKFLAAAETVHHLDAPTFDTDALPDNGVVAVVPAAP
jgi:L-ascorbate metabolism protein UlaG (beta-lactamase superfamily)